MFVFILVVTLSFNFISELHSLWNECHKIVINFVIIWNLEDFVIFPLCELKLRHKSYVEPLIADQTIKINESIVWRIPRVAVIVHKYLSLPQ